MEEAGSKKQYNRRDFIVAVLCSIICFGAAGAVMFFDYRPSLESVAAAAYLALGAVSLCVGRLMID